MGVALDSSFLIDVMRSVPNAVERLEVLEERREDVAIPTPALYELLAGTMMHRGRATAHRLGSFLSPFQALPLDREAALRAAEITTELAGLGRAKPHVDVLIAGIALRTSRVLVTRDRDFDDISHITGLAVDRY